MRLNLFLLMCFAVCSFGHADQVVNGGNAGSTNNFSAGNMAAYKVSQANRGEIGLPGTQGVLGRSSCDNISEYIGMFRKNGAPIKLERCEEDSKGIFHLDITAPKDMKCNTTKYSFVKITRTESAKTTDSKFMAKSFQDNTGRIVREALKDLNITVISSSQNDVASNQNYQAFAIPICD